MLFYRRGAEVEIYFDKPLVMGVLNVTPDSFSDGGKHYDAGDISCAKALDHARKMHAEGASFIDVGGESTRPGAKPVSLQQELDRVIPVIEEIAANIDCIISVDTSSPDVMLEAARAGAGLINDVRAFQREGAIEAAAASGLPLCIMHMAGEPDTMQIKPRYESLVTEVRDFLLERIHACANMGIDASRIIVDPGFGFGKTLEHNLQLVKSLAELRIGNTPILVGMSRKSMIGAILNREADQRLHGGLALAAIAVNNGASIIRTHDVAPTCDAVDIAYAVRSVKL